MPRLLLLLLLLLPLPLALQLLLLLLLLLPLLRHWRPRLSSCPLTRCHFLAPLRPQKQPCHQLRLLLLLRLQLPPPPLSM